MFSILCCCLLLTHLPFCFHSYFFSVFSGHLEQSRLIHSIFCVSEFSSCIHVDFDICICIMYIQESFSLVLKFVRQFKSFCQRQTFLVQWHVLFMWEQCPYGHLLRKFPKVADWANEPEATLCEAFRILVGSPLDIPEKKKICFMILPLFHFSLYLNFYPGCV